jgi:hypothetical protein
MNRIEDKLKNLILRNISFILDGKTIKRGKINILNTKQNFIKFKIDNGVDVKEWELSYPYDIKTIENGYIFDYSLSAFCPITEESYWKMKVMNKSESSKLHDNYLYVMTLSS